MHEDWSRSSRRSIALRHSARSGWVCARGWWRQAITCLRGVIDLPIRKEALRWALLFGAIAWFYGVVFLAAWVLGVDPFDDDDILTLVIGVCALPVPFLLLYLWRTGREWLKWLNEGDC